MAKKNEALTPKQLAFIDHFIVSLNATDAAKKAGYAEKSARSTASDLLTKPNIQKIIDERRRVRELEFEVKREAVLLEIGALAFTDLSDFCVLSGENVGVKDLDELPRHMKKAIKKVTFRTTTHESKGNSTTHTTATIEMHDKIKALELLGKHFGMFDGDGNGDDKGAKKSNASSILAAVRRAAGV